MPTINLPGHHTELTLDTEVHPNEVRKKAWNFKGAVEKDIALLSACVKYKAWAFKYNEKKEGWNKVQDTTWRNMPEDIIFCVH